MSNVAVSKKGEPESVRVLIGGTMFWLSNWRSLHRVLLVVGLILSATFACAQGKWVKLAPFPQPAEEISGAAAAGKM